MKQRYKKPPNVGKDKRRADAQYEEPFEAQKARQDKARETPELGSKAFHGVIGQIACKVAKETEADGRAILVGLLVGCGNIIGRTAYCRVDATHHFGSEFACLVGRTAGARKGLATDLVEEILRLTSDVWHQGCTVRGVSSGEGFIELVHDEVTKLVRVKREKGDRGPVQYETQVVKEGIADKRKLCLLSEFGELLTVSTRDGNIISTVLRNCWDGKTLEINTKQFPQRATGAHISIIGNITQKELLKLLPQLPSADGFCNRFLWCLIERSQRRAKGGPRLTEYLVNEITELRGILARIPYASTEIERSPGAEKLWEEIYEQLSDDTDLARAVVDRAEAHVLRFSLLYALLDGLQQIQEIHINAALALWRYCEACAVKLFGVEELEREEQLTLDYLRARGEEGATRTEIQNRVFHNHRTGKEILGWLVNLKDRELVTFKTETADNGNLVERWFALKYSGPDGEEQKPPPPRKTKKDETKNPVSEHESTVHDFAVNSHPIAKSCSFTGAGRWHEFAEFAEFAGENNQNCQAAPVKDPPGVQKTSPNSANSVNSANSSHQIAPVKKQNFASTRKFSANSAGHQAAPVKDSKNARKKAANSANSANSCHRPAPVKEHDFANRCEFIANSYFTHITEKVQVSQALASLKGTSSIALDTETSADKLRLIQLCNGSNPPVILDVPAEDIKTELVEFLRGRDLIIQNSKFDLRILKNAVGLEISIARVFDTYIASAVLTNTKVTEELKKRRRRNWHPNSLESIARRTLGIALDKTFQKANWAVDLSLPENAPMLAYAAADVRYSHAIRLHQEAELESQKLRPVYELERDLVPCVNAMSEAGVSVDMDEVHRLGAEATASAAKHEAKVLLLLGRKINVRSRKAQLLPALQELGITINGETITKTDKKLLPLVDQKDHPAIGAILEWSVANEEAKQLAQWPKHADSGNIVRPQINQFGTVTGRFTYSAPNLQQVKKSALRSIIVAPPGYLILRADFKTIELILAAVHYGETAILEQVAAGVDLHTLTATVLFHCAVKDVSKPQREMAKTTNFSLLYGRSLETYISACRLAGINDDVEELERIYRDFDKAWPNWALYKAQVAAQIARRTHPREVRSMYGRRIILDPSLSNREIRGALLNFPIQSSGSDELKLTMVNVWQENPEGFRLLASIHDEILALVKPDQVKYAKALLREAAVNAACRVMQNDIPIPLEIGVGKNWWEAIQDKEENK
jgi:DNA polymerase I-like protein with 3'-5' exonuclease and polymerase domains